MSLDIYTDEEIKDFIKAIDLKLNSAIKMSDLDTGQSQHEFQINIESLKKQRDYWLTMYKQQTGNDGGIVCLQSTGL